MTCSNTSPTLHATQVSCAVQCAANHKSFYRWLHGLAACPGCSLSPSSRWQLHHDDHVVTNIVCGPWQGFSPWAPQPLWGEYHFTSSKCFESRVIVTVGLGVMQEEWQSPSSSHLPARAPSDVGAALMRCSVCLHCILRFVPFTVRCVLCTLYCVLCAFSFVCACACDKNMYGVYYGVTLDASPSHAVTQLLDLAKLDLKQDLIQEGTLHSRPNSTLPTCTLPGLTCLTCMPSVNTNSCTAAS